MRCATLFMVLTLAAAPVSAQRCDADNAGLTLPDGFCAQLMATGLDGVRHMAIAANGDVFVAVPAGRNNADGAGVWVLRDTTGDGRADMRVRVLDVTNAQEVELVVTARGGWLYYSTTNAVVRHAWVAGQVTVGPGETIVSGMTDRRQHAAKTMVIGADGMLYVNIGAPSNSCQVADRQERSPGQDPCPILEEAGGVWRFDANRRGQTQADGVRFTTGIRNMVALAVHEQSGALYGLQHGRDALGQIWGFSDEASAELPAEEMFLLREGDDFGWPYCYYDGQQGRKVLSPEFGGDGTATGRCAEKRDPVAVFPAHWAPNGLTFYTGTGFPASYRGGAFIAFHGSWNRAPLPQEGYNLVFVPFAADGTPGRWTVFADGFRTASRPVDVAMAPDGSLVVTDDRGGRVFRIRYRGGS